MDVNQMQLDSNKDTGNVVSSSSVVPTALQNASYNSSSTTATSSPPNVATDTTISTTHAQYYLSNPETRFLGGNSNDNNTDADIGTEGQELYPIAILVEELKNDDVQLRLNAIQNLGTIAMALGPQRTRDELIPFLNDSIDDEDEVLLAVAEELANFYEYVGGPEYAHTLLGPLENLSAVEEVLVREKAVESLCKLVTVFNAHQIEHYFLPLLNRLTNGEWFTSRTSATGLFASVYDQCTITQKAELQNLFAQLIQDDTPMVRRTAAKALGTFAKKMDKKDFLQNMLPYFIKLTKDDQDTVRLLTVEDLLQATSILTLEEKKQHLLPILKVLGQDKSWRVRFMVATHFAQLCEAFGLTVTQEELVDLFVALIKDSEGEVKIMTIGQAPAFAKMIDEVTMVDKLLPCVKDLVIDTNQHVRAAVAANISGLAPTLGKEVTIEYLLPLFLQLLKDDFPDVRLNIISKLENVNQVIGVDRLSQSLLPAIVELAQDKQWRVRLAIIEYIPFLASQLGVTFFDEKLLDLCISWLVDTVFSIRDAATTNLKQLVEIFGCDWAKTTVIPRVMTMAGNENYLYRMTTLFALSTMAVSLSPEIVKDNILPTVLGLVEDPIPNVRFNVAKSLEVLTPILRNNPTTEPLTASKVKPALEKLNDDADMDVRWFAEKALLTV
ncbi:armadillo-type protein [Halteromyces radiatus]|uniref:armadillo-type protein n=1 Tax=Halteromyces radiatus TaxID=101107 RepID=UPI0022206944|nr:armadillo-type protein [Halteromyces radiatus]KAI8089836.1 armadillo-type protein [Halteromyces radiatus]